MQIVWRLPDSIRRLAEHLLFLQRADEDATGLLTNGDPKQRTTVGHSRRLWKPIAVLGLLICGFLLSSHRLMTDVSPVAAEISPTSHEDHVLHVLLPTRLQPMETCRTILSGAALNYPILWAISWNADVDENFKDIGGDLAKLESIRAFLEIQPESRNNHTVIVLGNPRSWFQARPEVLLRRYRSIQQEYRIVQQEYHHQSLRQSAIGKHFKQRIVLSAEKGCLSKKGADCLPIRTEDNTPRFVNHNLAMGTVEELRLLYRDAVVEATELTALKYAFDEHSVLARLVSHQQHVNNDPREYSIALDLTDSLSFAATSDEGYVGSDSPSTGTGHSHAPLSHKHPSRLSEDILTSEPPFQAFPDDLHLRSWSDFSFLMPTSNAGTVPVIAQQSAEFDSNLSQAWYEQLWFHPHGRKLVGAYAVSTSTAIATFVDSDGVEQRFYSPHAEPLGALAANNDLHPWSEICDGHEDWTGELFVDGMGT